jgi:hypothetical protein
MPINSCRSYLPNLTAEDLKDLGVAIVGHRRMMLDAIAAGHPKLYAMPIAPGCKSRGGETVLVGGRPMRSVDHRGEFGGKAMRVSRPPCR